MPRIKTLGTVKFFKKDQGFGFISLDDGREAFVHITDIIGEGEDKALAKGQMVACSLRESKKGLQAVDVEQAVPDGSNWHMLIDCKPFPKKDFD